MFKKTAKPKLEIESVHEVEKIGIILDNTPQGKIALEIGTLLAERVGSSVDIIVSELYYEAFQMLMEATQNEIEELKDLAKAKIEERDLFSKFEVVVAYKIEKALEIFMEEIEEEQKLGGRLVAKMAERNDDIVVLGVPLFQGREEIDIGDLGGYVSKLLRERKIHSNFLLLSDAVPEEMKNSILCFVSIEQQPGSIVALTRRGLSLASEETDIHVVGLVEDKVIETLARVEQLGNEEIEEEEEEETLDLESAGERLTTKMTDTLDSIKITEDIPHKSFTGTVKKGSISSIVNGAIDEIKPGLVLVRSVAEIAENLDPIAEQITRIVLRAGYPCLVVWD
jgi:hypothetical protein